jgi:hypothetical protein
MGCGCDAHDDHVLHVNVVAERTKKVGCGTSVLFLVDAYHGRFEDAALNVYQSCDSMQCPDGRRKGTTAESARG